MEFRGLTATRKAKEVCAQVPGVMRLRDFIDRRDAVALLFRAMRATATAPSPEVLGTIGEAHFEHCFAQWYGVKRFWYDRKTVVSAEGMPCVIEVAVAETVDGGALWTGANFSPTFEPPLADTYLEAPKVTAYGLKWFLRNAHAAPESLSGVPTAVALHIVCPVLGFTDRGKTHFDAPPWMATQVAAALWTATKTLYGDEERRATNAAKAREREEAQAAQEERAKQAEAPKEMTRKEAVFLVMQDAWAFATGNGAYRISKRSLFYAVRDAIQAHTTRPLDDNYFTHTLLPAYEREYGDLPGVYAESRGVFHEPHTGTTIILDDAAVASYEVPNHLFNKMLFIEKRTVWPVLESARLAERYDMAILTGEGYATEAMHALFRSASKDKQYQLFVLHDADPDGYNIARLLQDESVNMQGKGYAVDVIDLGLFFEDAIALGIRPELFTRKKALQKELVLSDAARQAFEGEKQRGKNEWIGQRVELNALSAPQLVAYIERRLEECGARGKVIPPDPVLTRARRDTYDAQIAAKVRGVVERLLALEAITATVTKAYTHVIPHDGARPLVEEALAQHPAQEWKAPLRSQMREVLFEHHDAIEERVREELLAQIQKGALTTPTNEEENDV
jgi:hypothetical protein